MRTFGFSEAAHYCASFTAQTGAAEGSLDNLVKSTFASRKTIREGSPAFAEYRACALRESERHLFFAISQYRRCLDLLIPSSAAWAYVTMYYGCLFAAKAVLGMFGVVILNHSVVDVSRSSINSQELSFRRIGNRVGEISTTYTGSHRRFWDLFYRAASPLKPLASSTLSFALSPVANNPTWMIDNRNSVNYDMYSALQYSNTLATQYSAATFPDSLPGILKPQYSLLESLILVAVNFAEQLSLKTDALKTFSPTATCASIIEEQIYSREALSVVSKSKKDLILTALR
jgi:hypothetical protein